ncbi:MAG TPA: hypothetical protein VJ596_04005, partial [Gemmatimonadaceae bacterium]|nr:hypothetical protein [Gemmatimonadaceae bacterium]
MNRREMLRVLVAAVPLPAATGIFRRADRTSRTAETAITIGLQLYTVRDAMARDFEGTLARVAQIGYREVEFAGYFDRSAAAVRGALDAAGLR